MISTGVKYIDKISGGFRLGDNVVWQVSDGISIDLFIENFCNENRDFQDKIIYISFNYSPNTIFKKYEYLFKNSNTILIDAFTHGKGKSDPVFLDFYHDISNDLSNVICVEDPLDKGSFMDILNDIEQRKRMGSFYIFDSLTGLNELWKDEAAVLDFFVFTCPKLYDLNTLAYWVYERDAHSKEFIAGIMHITQIVLSLSASDSGLNKFKICKLEGREPFDGEDRYFKIYDRNIHFDEYRPEEKIQIGDMVKEQRSLMKITQSDLASRLGMTPGAVSQIENNITTPSIQTLIQLSTIFNRPVEFFIAPDLKPEKEYRIFKGGSGSDNFTGNHRITPLAGRSNDSFKPHLVTIRGGCIIEGPILLHKGHEFITVTEGTLNIAIDGDNVCLERGDSLYLEKSFITSLSSDSEICEFVYILI